MIRRLAAAGALAFAIAAGPVLAEATSTTDDQRAVMAADTAFYAASRTEGGGAWRDFADDGAALPAGTGKQAIGAYYARLYAKPGFALDWHPIWAKVVGDVGMTSGPYTAHLRGPDGADKVSTGNYVTVWQRQKDGGWRFVWDGGTPDK